METVVAFLVIILIGFWAVNILKPRKANKKEKFIGYMQRYDIDGEGYQSEVWEVTEDENDKYGGESKNSIMPFQERELVKSVLS